jgi:hypothetical protein
MVPSMSRKKMFADLQCVHDKSARGTFALLDKQLKSVGCPRPPLPTVGVDQDQHQDEFERDDDSQPIEDFRCLRSFLYTSDGGADQVRYKKVAAHCIAGFPLMLFVAVSCAMHNCQLVVKSGINTIDVWAKEQHKTWRYFSSLAKLVHIWRDYAKAIYDHWAVVHGATSAQQHARTLIPKCIAGRWGSIAGTEQRLAFSGHEQIQIVLQKVIKGKRRALRRARPRPRPALDAAAIADVEQVR